MGAECGLVVNRSSINGHATISNIQLLSLMHDSDASKETTAKCASFHLQPGLLQCNYYRYNPLAHLSFWANLPPTARWEYTSSHRLLTLSQRTSQEHTQPSYRAQSPPASSHHYPLHPHLAFFERAYRCRRGQHVDSQTHSPLRGAKSVPISNNCFFSSYPLRSAKNSSSPSALANSNCMRKTAMPLPFGRTGESPHPRTYNNCTYSSMSSVLIVGGVPFGRGGCIDSRVYSILGFRSGPVEERRVQSRLVQERELAGGPTGLVCRRNERRVAQEAPLNMKCIFLPTRALCLTRQYMLKKAWPVQPIFILHADISLIIQVI